MLAMLPFSARSFRRLKLAAEGEAGGAEAAQAADAPMSDGG